MVRRLFRPVAYQYRGQDSNRFCGANGKAWRYDMREIFLLPALLEARTKRRRAGGNKTSLPKAWVDMGLLG